MRGGVRWWIIRLLMGKRSRLILKDALDLRFFAICQGKVSDAREQGEECLEMLEKLTP